MVLERDRLEYCVQYNESDLDFVQRLLEEHGIYYFFRHEVDRHVAVFADSISGYRQIASGPIPFESGSTRPNSIKSWARRMQFVSGRWSHGDYNYLSPAVKLHSESPSIVKLPAVKAYEQFEYPGRHGTAAVGEQKARVQMEAEEATHETFRGDGTCLAIAPGSVFEIADPDGERDALQEGRFLVTRVFHVARDESLDVDGTNNTSYANEFESIPASVVYKPRSVTPRPRVQGPQTAIVVGPRGETIFTDKYGRVKVRFHWDRSGSLDENSSCWIRVAQPWAGKNFGGLVLPRIGHEVVVEFLDGDPDRPLINGSVFNAVNLPPQELPADKAKMTIRSSSIDGVGSNEITMADSGGKEGFYVHAQHDLEEVVENDRTSSVGNDESHTVGNNQTLTVSNDQTASIGNNQSLKVATNRTTEVGSASIDKVGTDKVIQAGANVVIDAGATLTLRCGAASITLTAAGIVNISGSMVNVSGSVNANVTAPITNLTGAALLNASGGVALFNGGVARVTGQSLMHIGGDKVESIAAGENLVQGATVKLN